MPVTIQRMLHGTYHLRVDSGEFILNAGDVAVIADRAIADDIVERSPVSHDKRNEAEELKRTRKFWRRKGDSYYRTAVCFEAALTLWILELLAGHDWPETRRDWIQLGLNAAWMLLMFHLAHTHFEADLRRKGL